MLPETHHEAARRQAVVALDPDAAWAIAFRDSLNSDALMQVVLPGNLDQLHPGGEQVEANRHTDRGRGFILVVKIVRFRTVVLGAVGVASCD